VSKGLEIFLGSILKEMVNFRLHQESDELSRLTFFGVLTNTHQATAVLTCGVFSDGHDDKLMP
jgi:hypothetical protein